MREKITTVDTIITRHRYGNDNIGINDKIADLRWVNYNNPFNRGETRANRSCLLADMAMMMLPTSRMVGYGDNERDIISNAMLLSPDLMFMKANIGKIHAIDKWDMTFGRADAEEIAGGIREWMAENKLQALSDAYLLSTLDGDSSMIVVGSKMPLDHKRRIRLHWNDMILGIPGNPKKTEAMPLGYILRILMSDNFDVDCLMGNKLFIYMTDRFLSAYDVMNLYDAMKLGEREMDDSARGLMVREILDDLDSEGTTQFEEYDEYDPKPFRDFFLRNSELIGLIKNDDARHFRWLYNAYKGDFGPYVSDELKLLMETL